MPRRDRHTFRPTRARRHRLYLEALANEREVIASSHTARELMEERQKAAREREDAVEAAKWGDDYRRQGSEAA